MMNNSITEQAHNAAIGMIICIAIIVMIVGMMLAVLVATKGV